MNYGAFRPQILETRDAPAREIQTHSGMTLAHVDTIYEIRRKMLFSLKGDIPIALADALDKKIKHEDAALRTLLGADEKKAEIKRARERRSPGRVFYSKTARCESTLRI